MSKFYFVIKSGKITTSTSIIVNNIILIRIRVNRLYIKMKESNVCVPSSGSPGFFTLRTTRRTVKKWRPVFYTRSAKVSGVF